MSLTPKALLNDGAIKNDKIAGITSATKELETETRKRMKNEVENAACVSIYVCACDCMYASNCRIFFSRKYFVT